MSRLAIIGAGSWGTALAIVLSPRFERIGLWAHEPDLADRIERNRTNNIYLPGFELPPNVHATHELCNALGDARFVLGVMPSRFARTVYSQLKQYTGPDTMVVSTTKGFEAGSLARISEVAKQELAGSPVAVLSGPTFAREIARGDPAAVVIASTDNNLARHIQTAFSTLAVRLYRNPDPVGVEVGAACKNVIAIAAGICAGLGLGNNSMAALITRGLAEITRLAVAMGGKAETLAGLAGLGDLVLTCMGELSRNRRVGIELAKGRALEDIVADSAMIAEGIETTISSIALAEKHSIEMPITQQVACILRGERTPREALRELLDRSLKNEPS